MDGITEFGRRGLGYGSFSSLTSLSSVTVLLMDSSSVGLKLFIVLRVLFLMACWNGREMLARIRRFLVQYWE
jgi:type III secretory pathway component EscS